MRHGTAAHETIQCLLVTAQQVDLVTQIVILHGDDLPAFVGKETFQFGQLFQSFRFCDHLVGKRLEVIQCGCGILICAGEQQGIQLRLRTGDGNDFQYVFLIGILFHGRITADTIMTAQGAANGETVQHGGDDFGIGQVYRLL